MWHLDWLVIIIMYSLQLCSYVAVSEGLENLRVKPTANCYKH